MKKNLTILSVIVMSFALMCVGVVSASRTVDDVTLNGGTNVIVSAGDDVEVELTVETSPEGVSDYNDWASTGYVIEGEDEVCMNVPDPDETIGGQDPYTESFMITIPGLSPGDYDFSVVAYQEAGCTGPGSNTFNLDDAISVKGCNSGDCSISILNPIEDNFYCENPLLIDWTKSGKDCSPGSTVYYGIWNGESCDYDENEIALPWDTSGLSDGEYCIWVQNDGCCAHDEVAPFCIDCTKPEVSICTSECCGGGIESDTQSEKTETVINIDYSDPDNNCDQECELQCSINWGDDSCEEEEEPLYIPCDEVCDDGECTHQYGDNGEYTVTVRVEDCAGNVGTNETDVEVENVPPKCNITDISPEDLVAGLPITFTGTAYDVLADLFKMSYSWDFGDESADVDGNPSMHIYSAGQYNVTLTVDDGDDTGTCTAEIEVAPVIPLDNQELAVCECLDADFGENAGDEADNAFETGLDGDATCSFIGDHPAGLNVQGVEDDCKVTWCGSKEQGVYPIVVKATDGENTEYYSFNIEVFDYGIYLDAGWNLFSIPLVPENDDTSIDTVLSGIIENVVYEGTNVATVLHYDAVEDTWEKSRRYSDAHGFTWGTGSKLTNIVPGYGYWIYMENADTLYLNGEKMYNADSYAYPPSVTLAMDSWNLIGVYGAGDCCHTSVKISDALISLTDEEENAYYDIIYDENGYSPMFSLKSKEGYWLSIKKVFAGDEETIQYKANYKTFPWFD